MSIRFDGTGADNLNRAITFSANTGTIMAWVRIVTDRDTYTSFFNPRAVASQEVLIQTDGTGTRIGLWQADFMTTGTNLTVGQWYHLALINSSTACTVYLDGVQDITRAHAAGALTWTQAYFGTNSLATSEALNGNIGIIKVWNATLTVAEINAEKHIILPQRYANISGWWPTFPGERTLDYSRQGNLTQVGTVTDEANPPVSWGASPIVVPSLAVGNVTAEPTTGALTITGQAPTLAASSAAVPTTKALVATALAPTVAITANVTAQPTTGTLAVVGQAPTWSIIGSFAPDTVLAAANLQDTLNNIPPTRIADIDESVDASDGEWWTATAPGAVTDVRVGFETPPATALVGMQQIRVLVRGSSLPARDVTVELWENGVKLTSEVTETVTSDTGQIITLSFPASEITDLADVEVRIVAEACVMAAIIHFVKTDITQRTTSSTTAVELTNYTIAWTDLTAAGFAAGDDVLVRVACKVGNGNANGNSDFTVGFGTTFAGRTDDTSSHWQVEPVGGGAALQYQWFDRKTLVVNENVYFSGLSPTASAAQYDELVVWVIKLGDLTSNDFLYAENAPGTATPTTYDTSGAGATVPATGDWLLFASARFDCVTVSSDVMLAIHDGTTDQSEVRSEGEDATDFHVYGTLAYRAGLAASTTVRVRHRAETASNWNTTHTRIFGLRLDAFEDHDGVHTTNTVTNSVLDAYSEFAGFPAYSKTSTGPFAVVGWPIHNNGAATPDAACRPYGRIQINGSDWPVANANRKAVLGQRPFARHPDGAAALWIQREPGRGHARHRPGLR